MASKMYYLSGESMYAKVYPTNMDEYGGERFYSMDLIMDENTARNLEATKTKKKISPTEDGRFKVKFRRDAEHRIPEFGGPPKVTDSEGNDFKELIGNGSEVTVCISIYDTKMGKGTRLESVRVDKHVPYEKIVNLSEQAQPEVDENKPPF